nr:lamin tail domain-containing protein [Metabacillus litoralis]
MDGGRKSAGSKLISFLQEKGIQSIDLLVATHPDADHIGGLIDVLEQVEVKKVLDSGKPHTTQTYMEYLALIDQKNIPFEVAKKGSFITLDSDIKIQVLNSLNSSEDLNDSSVVLKLTYGVVDFLLTGDAGIENEADMVANYNLEAEILKVGHHGSDTSTSQPFVNEVDPETAILSYGENNYGHPNAGVVKRLRNIGAEIYSTFESGDIVVTTDGTNYDVSALPSEEGEDSTTPLPDLKDGVFISVGDFEMEYVTILNNTNENADLSNWYLISEEGNQCYDFPEGTIIESGYYLDVLSGPDAYDSPPYKQMWTKSYIWNNSGDAALLYNSKGELVSEFR